jgi:hypothetical protein
MSTATSASRKKKGVAMMEQVLIQAAICKEKRKK